MPATETSQLYITLVTPQNRHTQMVIPDNLAPARSEWETQSKEKKCEHFIAVIWQRDADDKKGLTFLCLVCSMEHVLVQGCLSLAKQHRHFFINMCLSQEYLTMPKMVP